jgi:hypothetical protein
MSIFPTDIDKRALLEGRLRGFAYDAYGHELNRQVALATGDTEAVQVADRALAAIAVAKVTYEQELASLPTASDVAVDYGSEPV